MLMSVSFGSPVLSSVGHDPGVLAADLNADGKPDLAVADATGHTLRVMLGDGSGRFANPTVYDAGNSPNFVVAGDFNNDGKVDLAFTHWFGNTVSLMLGDGTGHFGAMRSFPAGGGNPVHAQANDFNHDGNLDLATSGWGSGGVRILPGDGRGGFLSPIVYPTNTNTLGLVQADFNADHHQDLAVSNVGEGTVSVYMNDGTGHFTAREFPAGSIPNNLGVGDYNGDGKTDIAASHGVFGGAEESLSLLFGDGAGHFSAPARVEQDIAGFVTADFDGDGRSDVAFRRPNDEQVYVRLGDGAGGFGAPAGFDAGDIGGVMTADFNGDGRADLGAVRASETLAVLLNGAPPPARETLVIEGTPGDDRILVERTADRRGVNVTVNGSTTMRLLSEIARLELRGLGGNDRIDVSGRVNVPATIDGGEGNDVLKGGSGDDMILGGDGKDVMDGRGGADVFRGGRGRDAADYTSRRNSVTVSVGTGADDGEGEERDDVTIDVEDVYGGRGNDVLTGSRFDNRLVGGAGNDRLVGNGGRDQLSGGAGADRLFSRDASPAPSNRDLLAGGDGDDEAEIDSFDTPAGIERVLA